MPSTAADPGFRGRGGGGGGVLSASGPIRKAGSGAVGFWPDTNVGVVGGGEL